MRRVVVTGMGIVSCLGNAAATVSSALRECRSGIRLIPDYVERGLRSQVAGEPQIDLTESIDRKLKRFMGDAAAYAYVAMRDAIADADLALEHIRHPRTGVIAGSGGGSAQWQIQTGELLREKGVRRIGPYMVPRTMCSTVSATLATAFGILGLSYSIAAACATSGHCIGAAADLIRYDAQDVMFGGGGEELHWGMTAQFDAMGALSHSYNDIPQTASRPYDTRRDGFVIAGGGGMLVLEEYEHARARGETDHGDVQQLRFRRHQRQPRLRKDLRSQAGLRVAGRCCQSADSTFTRKAKAPNWRVESINRRSHRSKWMEVGSPQRDPPDSPLDGSTKPAGLRRTTSPLSTSCVRGQHPPEPMSRLHGSHLQWHPSLGSNGST